MIDAEKPDAIVAITPLELTLDIGRELLSLGIPVLLEKPPGRTVGEAIELSRAAESYGTPHMVSLNRRFNPAVVGAREWLRGRSEAEALQITGRMLRVSRLEDYFISGTAIHLVDTILSFMDGVTQVYSERWQTKAGGRSASAQLCGSKTKALLLIAPDSGAVVEPCKIVGDDFCIEIDVLGSTLSIMQSGSLTLERRFDDQPPFVMDGSYAEILSFIHSVENGDRLSPTLQEALLSMRTVDAIERGAMGDISWRT